MALKRNQPTADPQKLVFITPGVSGKGWEQEEEGVLKHVSPNATILHVPAHNVQDAILAAIKQQVAEQGTLKEIVIAAHGSPNNLYATQDGQDGTSIMQTDHFLNGIADIQKEFGVKVADRIVFTGCSVMTDLSPQWVDYYRGTAKALGTEIVGNTTIGWGDNLQEAGVARFGPDGSVSRDHLDSSPLFLFLDTAHYKVRAFLAGDKDATAGNTHSDSWFTCHNGRTQEAGAACQADKSLSNIRSAEIAENLAFTEIQAPFGNPIPDHLKLSAIGVEGWREIGPRIENSLISLKGGDWTYVRAVLDQQALGNSVNRNDTAYDLAAVDAHEKFIRNLSPEAQTIIEHLVADYKEAHPPAQPPRANRPNVHVLKSTPFDILSQSGSGSAISDRFSTRSPADGQAKTAREIASSAKLFTPT